MGKITSYSQTLSDLETELNQLGVYQGVVLQVDVVSDRDIRLDGFMRSDARVASPAIVLTFEKEIANRQAPVTFACDRFTTWQDNLRAIALGMESLRRVERYGITAAGQQYRGFAALPSSTTAALSTHQAAEVLAKRTTALAAHILANVESARLTYRTARAKAHPDHGGSSAEFNLVQEAGRVLGVPHGVTL